MRAYIMPAGCRSVDDLRLVDRPEPAPGAGQVLVTVRATSLNRRDQAIADGTYFGRRVTADTIPLSDCAGEIAAVGRGVTRVAVGDRVAATFFQTPPNGPPFAPQAALGFPLDGVLAERIVLHEDGVVPIPAALSFEESACLPCAALTAWHALMAAGRPVGPGQTVLILGSGGVSVFALQFAVAAGASVIATSSSDAKLERLKALGASATVNYVRSPEWHKDVLQLTGGRGADCIVEVVGAGTLEQSFDAVAESGKVCLIGALKGRRAEISPYALMFKQATLHGVRVGSRDMFEQMNRAIAAGPIHPVIDRSFSFVDAIAAYHLLVSQTFLGKIVIAL
jgi:NADPH:quinone reductase-like Zn-dependent oxidoreductase